MYSPMENTMEVLQGLKTELPYDPDVIILDIFPK